MAGEGGLVRLPSWGRRRRWVGVAKPEYVWLRMGCSLGRAQNRSIFALLHCYFFFIFFWSWILPSVPSFFIVVTYPQPPPRLELLGDILHTFLRNNDYLLIVDRAGGYTRETPAQDHQPIPNYRVRSTSNPHLPSEKLCTKGSCRLSAALRIHLRHLMIPYYVSDSADLEGRRNDMADMRYPPTYATVGKPP